MFIFSIYAHEEHCRCMKSMGNLSANYYQLNMNSRAPMLYEDRWDIHYHVSSGWNVNKKVKGIVKFKKSKSGLVVQAPTQLFFIFFIFVHESGQSEYFLDLCIFFKLTRPQSQLAVT